MPAFIPINIVASSVAMCSGYILDNYLRINLLWPNLLSVTSFPCAWHSTKPLNIKKKETPQSPPKQNSSEFIHVKCDMNIRNMNIILQPCNVSIILFVVSPLSYYGFC